MFKIFNVNITTKFRQLMFNAVVKHVVLLKNFNKLDFMIERKK